MNKTLDQIRAEGFAALRDKLGRAGMIRFLQQFDAGHGDYAEDRREWAEKTSLAEICTLSRKRKRRV